MALKFRKRVRLFPGFSLNLSKSGMSATVGIKGFSVNIGPHGTYLNTGIPGTGIYDRIRLDGADSNAPEPNGNNVPDHSLTDSYYVEKEIKSFNPELLTSDSMYGLKQSILDAKKVKQEMYNEYQEANSSKNLTLFFLILLHIVIIGFFLKKLKAQYNEKKRFANELKQDYENFSLKIEFNFDKGLLNDYITLRKAFTQVSNSQRVWDITSYKRTDKFHERTIADNSVSRTPVSFCEDTLSFINVDYSALVFKNANGGDLFLYPGFLIMKDKGNDAFAIIDLKTVQVNISTSHFHEEESVPTDSTNVGYTWKYCNKNGTRDKRFNNNYQIPIMKYCRLNFNSEDGLNEEYMVSNFDDCALFGTLIKNYIDVLSKMKWESSRINENMLEESVTN